jgi:hypothetical protein
MVDKWERESVGSPSPTRRSDRSYSRSDSESDNGGELDEGEVAAEEDVDVLGTSVSVILGNGASSVAAADDEPSIEDLLASESAPGVPMDGSWGAHAWEELDAGTTIRRIEPHDTVAPRHEGSGSSADVGSGSIFETLSKRGGGANTSSSRRIRGTNRVDRRLARHTAADITSLLDAPSHLPRSRTCPLPCFTLGRASSLASLLDTPPSMTRSRKCPLPCLALGRALSLASFWDMRCPPKRFQSPREYKPRCVPRLS